MGKTKEAKTKAEAYSMTETERQIITKRAAERANKAPGMKRLPRQRRVVPDHPNESVGYEMIFEEMGVGWDVGAELMSQLKMACSQNEEVDLRKLNFLLSFIKSFKPDSPRKTFLVAQMAIVHQALMSAATYLAQSNNEIRYERMERALNRLARTSVLQIDALERLTNGGRQTIVVKQMAVVGTVQTRDDSKPALARPEDSPMPIIEGDAVNPDDLAPVRKKRD